MPSTSDQALERIHRLVGATNGVATTRITVRGDLIARLVVG